MNSTIAHCLRLFRRGARVKRPTRAAWRLASVPALFLAAAAPAPGVTSGSPILEERLKDFSPEEYRAGVDRLLAGFEAERGSPIAPGRTGRVGLKVYANSGAGLSTPLPLVRAIAASLLERGFSREEIFLIDLSETRLRAAGFLPGLGEGGRSFDGHPVHVLESGDYYDGIWYYDSPLPPRREGVGAMHRRGEFNFQPDRESRRSYLPRPLLLDVDFWINLPVYSDHPVLGVNGALVNATLWNASNTSRFFHSSASGPAAVAEMAAVPELAENWIFSVVSLERYQFVGGPVFRSLYTVSEPLLMLSADPVALDSRMQRKINERRVERGFQAFDEGETLIDYARQLGLGRPEAPSRPDFLRNDSGEE